MYTCTHKLCSLVFAFLIANRRKRIYHLHFPTPALAHGLQPITSLPSTKVASMLTSSNLCVKRVACTARPRTVVVPVRPLRVAAKAKEVYPGPQEEKEAAHEAFLHAFEASKPSHIPGLQQFAAAIWERRRRIPSTTYNDPLDHIFSEFDEDGDGHLTADEVARALQSHKVEATPEQIQKYINVIDENGNGTVERSEFASFIFHMATEDLKSMSMSE